MRIQRTYSTACLVRFFRSSWTRAGRERMLGCHFPTLPVALALWMKHDAISCVYSEAKVFWGRAAWTVRYGESRTICLFLKTTVLWIHLHAGHTRSLYVYENECGIYRTLEILTGISLSGNIFHGPIYSTATSRLYARIRITRFSLRHAHRAITEICALSLVKPVWRHRPLVNHSCASRISQSDPWISVLSRLITASHWRFWFAQQVDWKFKVFQVHSILRSILVNILLFTPKKAHRVKTVLQNAVPLSHLRAMYTDVKADPRFIHFLYFTTSQIHRT